MVPSDMLEQCLVQPYDHYEHINNIKHLLHVWTGCDMSMKGVGVPLIAYIAMPFDCPTRKSPVRTPTLLILIRNYLFVSR